MVPQFIALALTEVFLFMPDLVGLTVAFLQFMFPNLI